MVFVWVVIFVLIVIDLVLAETGRQTISDAVRKIDSVTGGLLRWQMFGLWLHLFVGVWPEWRK